MTIQQIEAAAAEAAAAEQQLRELVVAADRGGVPQAAIARAARKSRGTVIRWLKQSQDEGTVHS